MTPVARVRSLNATFTDSLSSGSGSQVWIGRHVVLASSVRLSFSSAIDCPRQNVGAHEIVIKPVSSSKEVVLGGVHAACQSVWHAPR